MGLSPNQAIKLGCEMVQVNRPYLMVGPPGCGKTDAAKEVANLTGRKLYLSQPAIDDPVDYKGFAFFQNGKADFFPLGMIRDIMAEREPALWVIDDLGQAVIAVQNAIMQFVHHRNRNLNGMLIPDNVSIVACSNGREHNAGVVGMTDPLKSRFVTIIPIETSLDSWTKWACSHGIDPLIVAYLHYRPNSLNDFQANKDFEQSPTPRAWESVNELMNINVEPEILTTVLAGAIGEHCAVEFGAFRNILHTLPDLDEIELDGKNAMVPTENMAAYAVSGALAARGLTESTLQQVMHYVERLPSEYIVLWTEVWSTRNPAKMKEPLWTKWCLDHQAILAI